MNILDEIKEIFNIENTDPLIEYVDSNLFTSDHDKQNYSENQTPRFIRENMISYIPDNIWEYPNIKVFDPCAGKCVFILLMIKKLMIGLKKKIKNPNKRYKFIVEECIYFADINEENINICKLLIDPFNQYNLNYYIGDTLKLNIQEIWNIDGFNIILVNPPFQIKIGNNNKTFAIWDRFFKKMIEISLKNGHIGFVSPPSWRAPSGNFREVFEIIKEKRLIYLNMNSLEAGHRDFNVAIPYDYYVVQNVDNGNNYKTDIVDVYDHKINIDLSSWKFIPFGSFDIFTKLLAKNDEEKVNILYDCSTYDSRKLSKTQTEEYKYPICYTITKKKGMNKLYSKRYKDNHFIPKIIWSNGIGTYPIVDKGEVGCSQFSYAIIDDIENLEHIKKAMEKEQFINLMKCTKFNNHKYDHKTIKLFRRDFYKAFI
jgi:hypothetical protein